MRVKVILGQTDASYSQHIVDITHIAGNLVLCLLQFVGVLLQLSVRMGNLGYITSRTEETDALTIVIADRHYLQLVIQLVAFQQIVQCTPIVRSVVNLCGIEDFEVVEIQIFYTQHIG